jgi:very-short-patch-repair endonuclease
MTKLDRARELRKNLTDVERLAWRKLRSRRFAGYKFRRQMPVGRYIVDFVCLERKLIVELDGGQHNEQVDYDQARTEWLKSQGFEVLRFWNHEVFEDWGAIEEVIWGRLHSGSGVSAQTLNRSRKKPSPPTPLPRGERGE